MSVSGSLELMSEKSERREEDMSWAGQPRTPPQEPAPAPASSPRPATISILSWSCMAGSWPGPGAAPPYCGSAVSCAGKCFLRWRKLAPGTRASSREVRVILRWDLWIQHSQGTLTTLSCKMRFT